MRALENAMAVFHHRPPERIPWLTYDIPYHMLLASVCLFGGDAMRKETLNILRTVAPGDNFMLSVTEDIPYKDLHDVLESSLRIITEVMSEHGAYPLKL